jgi:hypothetical protein
LGLILLLLGVSPLLNIDIYSVKDQLCVKETDFQAKFNGVYQDNKPGSGVSISHSPSRVESGSYVQFSNNDAIGNSIFGILNIFNIFSDHFTRVFSMIGPTGAEI